MQVKGCVHVHIKDGAIVNVFSHLTNMPDHCVIHLVPDAVRTQKQFAESHPQDRNELLTEPEGAVFNLGDDSV